MAEPIRRTITARIVQIADFPGPDAGTRTITIQRADGRSLTSDPIPLAVLSAWASALITDLAAVATPTR